MIFALCISVLRSTGVKVSLPTLLDQRCRGGLEEGK